MKQLVYPAPEPRSTMPRHYAVALFLASLMAYVALMVLIGIYLSWTSVFTATLLGVYFGYRQRRLRTIVTAEVIAVRTLVGSWALPVAQAEELMDRNLGGDPVYVLSRSGRRRCLPQVKPADLSDISELTGLPIRWRARS
ncbi:hypothetical protein [Kineosporia sp. NBRC 101731]|uniref:hypothetical protein n=1 Tax=Kineosporia sp. NBRC 101731 TaxID=3032199 RepID=UPI0024A2CF3D|nr:hypothetical protein [Kineosporia sp. NBRC 101731]GLY31584.1 hypothetical protein Kisp02_49490 [Kineosporia sp. NBRC 101731]